MRQMYCFGVIGHSLLLQLPLHNRYHRLVHNYGCITWDDVDWETFLGRNFGKSILCRIFVSKYFGVIPFSFDFRLLSLVIFSFESSRSTLIMHPKFWSKFRSKF